MVERLFDGLSEHERAEAQKLLDEIDGVRARMLRQGTTGRDKAH